MNYTSEDKETRFTDIMGQGEFSLDELSSLIDMFRHPGWPVYLKWTRVVQTNSGLACLDTDTSVEAWRRLQGNNSHICNVLGIETSVVSSRDNLLEKRKKMLDEQKHQ